MISPRVRARAGLLALLAPFVFAAPFAAAATEISEPAPLAAHSLLLDVARAGDVLIAVGDRGDVLRSHDEGKNWRQILVPTQAMLTAVSFADARHGWAVGHDGTILHTDDAGETWTRQDARTDLDTVWLDVLALDPNQAIAVGAYGCFRRTYDGGKTWIPETPQADEVHYNAIARDSAGSLYLAGESGMLLRSSDGGKSWKRLEVGYEGSLFGLLLPQAGHLVAFGLRGNTFVSEDAGQTWRPLETGTKSLLMAGASLDSQQIVLGGQGGTLLRVILGPGEPRVQPLPAASGSLSALLIARDGQLVTAGEAGLGRTPLQP